MLGDSSFLPILLLLINALVATAGFIISFSIARLIKAIDRLSLEDGKLHDRISDHREEVLQHYVRSDTFIYQLESVKKDVLGRMDRMDTSFKEALIAHEHREREFMVAKQRN